MGSAMLGDGRGTKFCAPTIIIFIFLTCLIFFAFLLQSSNRLDHTLHRIYIPEGVSTSAVGTILREQGILSHRKVFYITARLFRVDRHLQAGLYAFSPADTLWEILMKLRRGEVIPLQEVQVTFPEGSSIYKMGEILKTAGVEQAEGFQSLTDEGIKPPLRLRHWGIFKYIPSESLEGYLYPDTYRFFSQASPEVMAEVMLQRFEAVVLPFWKTVRTRYTLHEILTMASIVEKEARLKSEQPIIASVFYNRLKAGMSLAADPTVKYALENPTKKVYFKQLEVDSPYNTYRRKGLPPGPICNPGIEAIKAAVYPARTSYYYFVAQKDGSHIFSRTWQEHAAAKKRVIGKE